MYRSYSVVRELAKTNPLPLLDIKDKKLIQYANNLLPYSIGLEFECSQLYDTPFFAYIESRKQTLEGSKKVSDYIPCLMAIRCTQDEQRFRIPKGIKGLVCLWYITLFLKQYYGLNPKSGIHYHVDMSEKSLKEIFWKKLEYSMREQREFKEKHNNWIISALKSWDYKGSYNAMQIAYDSKDAVKFHSDYSTMEVRIGEMTFDYQLLYKRVAHCTHIAQKLKKELLAPKMTPEVEKGSKLTDTKQITGRRSIYDIFAPHF